METKDQSMTTDVDENGNPYVSEISATYEQTMSDGTEVEAQITTTADPNDPTQAESHMTVSETAADGTETVNEYVVNEDGVFLVEEESPLENMVENTFGVEIDDNLIQIDPNTGLPMDETTVAAATTDQTDTDTEVYQAEADSPETSPDFTIGDESFTPTESTLESHGLVSDEPYTADTSEASTLDADATTDTEYVATAEPDDVYDATLDTPYDSTIETADTTAGTTDTTFASTDTTSTETTDTASTEAAETEAAEIAEQEAHTQAAVDAQAAADEYIATGDYAAAAEAREVAENESWEAGDDTMLSAYDSQDLANSADKQEDAAYYEAQEANLAQSGDYEGAREAASNAAYATSDADSTAGGDDHTGQADAEYQKMDMAAWEQDIADDKMQNAVDYANAGDFDNAEVYAASAEAHQESADDYGNQGEHGGEFGVYDSSSEVESGGTYESSYDSYDASAAVDTSYVDTSYDTTSSVDTSYDASTSYDTTSYDSGSDV